MKVLRVVRGGVMKVFEGGQGGGVMKVLRVVRGGGS